MSEPAIKESLGDEAECFYCPDGEAVIFLCGDGWICEECYRRLGDVPADVGDELHDIINSNDDQAQEWHIRISAAVDGSEDEDLVGV